MATEEIINEIHALVAAAIKGERERIVELLQDELGDMRPVGTHSIGVYDGLDHAIALIKGEN
jgi:hypothetical protein